MPTEIIVINFPVGSITPIPVSLGGASQTLFSNTGSSEVVIQTTADPNETDVFVLQVQPIAPLSITGTDDEYLYVRPLIAGVATSVQIMIMRRG